MPPISLPAHFDGKHILLDAPYTLEPETKLLVTVLPQVDEERDEWLRLSAQGLAGAYAASEPDYTLDAIRVANPDYEGGHHNLTSKGFTKRF